MKHRSCEKVYRIRFLTVMLALIMAFTAAFVLTVSQSVYAEGEEEGETVPVNVITAAKAAKDGSKYRITISNAQMNGSAAKKVQIKTWSKTRGQSDMVSYPAKKVNATTWRATVNSVKHCYSGMFISHVYVNGKLAGVTTYKMSFPSKMGRLIKRAQKKSSKTKWMVLVDKKTHHVGIFKGKKARWKLVKYWACGDGKSSTPTPAGTYKVSNKGPYFDSVTSRCYYFTMFKPHYYFHSVLCNPATGAPRAGKQLGVGVSHGCVRLAKSNARWLQSHVPAGSTVYIFK